MKKFLTKLGTRLLAAYCGLLAITAPSLAEKRVALVVGNAHYVNTPALVNPANDAADVAGALTAVGFDVTLKIDADKHALDQAIAQFARASTTADAALFYYAGHGMQFQGRNYVVPVDARLPDEISLRYELTAVDDVKAALQESSGVKIMVLDSCRDNPLAEKLVRSLKEQSRDIPKVQGLARTDQTTGMIIIYATQPDEVAADGAGRNSPFSAAFLREIEEPGLEIGAMFRRVGADVYHTTFGRQTPEISISLLSEYYLNQTETDQAIWARLRLTSDAPAIKAFLDRYPNSFYAVDAVARLELLRRQNLESKAAGAAAPTVKDPAEQASLLGSTQAPPRANDTTLAAIPTATLSDPISQPTDVTKPLLARRIRDELRRVGCYRGDGDEWNSPEIKRSLAKYALYAKLGTTPAEPTASVLSNLQQFRDRLCPPDCSVREIAVGGRCVAKTCGRDEAMNSVGRCVLRPAFHPRQVAARALEGVSTPRAAGNRCFVFNGRQYCE
jgi:hypothetical protein